LTVAVWAQQPEVLDAIVGAVAVLMIEDQDEGLATPNGR
jgi:hypothetical protein